MELQNVLDKLPKVKANEPEVKISSKTEVGVLEPSHALFRENSEEEH